MFPVPLHVRSRHSLGFGTASVEELAQRAADLKLPSLALTDIETLAGQLRFHDACLERGVKPITGVELRAGRTRRDPGEEQGRLVLLARDASGYANLCRIVSRRRTLPSSRASGDPIDSLGAGADGLFVLSDDAAVLAAIVEQGLVEKGRLGLLQRVPRGHGRGSAHPRASLTGVPVVADCEVVYLNAEDRELHILLRAIRERKSVADVEAEADEEAGQGTRKAEALDLEAEVPAALDGPANGAGALDEAALGRFAAMSPAVEETHRIAEACNLDLATAPRVRPRLPDLGECDASRELRRRCEHELAGGRSGGRSGGRAAGRFRGRQYDDRLERELATIERLGLGDYFLAVGEIVRGARELGIPVAARGSATGSLVAHLLGVSDIDPVEADLLFERFLHEKREAPPDIDLDVASTGRDALNEWVVRRFGREHVAGIATYATYRARSAVRSGLAALGLPPAKVDKAVSGLDRSGLVEAGGLDEGAQVERSLSRNLDPAVRAAAPLIGKLVGMPSHISAHPGGLVIAERPLEQLVPLERASGGAVVTQYDYRSAERAGLVKIDLLGNHFLSEMEEALSALPEGTVIPDDDEQTRQTLDRADTVGCFQVESPAVRSVLRRLPIRGFSDLVAALAVVRPGAAAGASKERYLRRARGEEEYQPLEVLGPGRGGSGGAGHASEGDGLQPETGQLEQGSDSRGRQERGSRDGDRYGRLAARLARTHGVLLFDEDIIRLLSTTGGMSLAEADALRSALVLAGDDPRSLQRLGDEFIERAIESGETRAVAQRAWRAAVRFASYSFAEAHAASYASLAWKAAWLKTHAPAQFGCALINHHRGLYPLRTVAAAVQRWGVAILPPSVNHSRLESSLQRPPSGGGGEDVGADEGAVAEAAPVVRVGLAAIKGLTKRTTKDILAGRPFGDLGELIEATRPAKRELRALLLSGACDGLPPLSSKAYPLVHDVVLDGLEGEAGPGALDQVLEQVARLPEEGRDAREFRRYQALVRVRNEIRYLDMHLSGHPMRLLRAEAGRLGCLRSSELHDHMDVEVGFAGLLAASRRVPTGQGEMRFLTWEDEDGLVESVLFPEANSRLAQRLTTPGPYLVRGVVRETQGDLHLVVNELEPFYARAQGN